MSRTYYHALALCVLLVQMAVPGRAELVSVEVPSLAGFYGGWSPPDRLGSYDFGQTFTVVESAWLQVEGFGDQRAVPPHGTLTFYVDWFEHPPEADLVIDPTPLDFNVDIPITPTALQLTGSGSVYLEMFNSSCCDMGATVTRATLWFEGETGGGGGTGGTGGSGGSGGTGGTPTSSCAGPNSGQGYILSSESNCSVDERAFDRSETLYQSIWSDSVDHTKMKKAGWELKDANKNKVKQTFTNHNNGTFSAAYDLIDLPSNATSLNWKGKLEDKRKNKYEEKTTITINP